MSALARYFKTKGIIVSGYDRTQTLLTRQLSVEGISVHYEDNIDFIDRAAQLVVYTPAIPADHRELGFYKDHGYRVVKRSDVLGMITESSFNICVAGTHGKTTTSTMVAHILRDSNYGCNAFLGGISGNYNTNFWSSRKDVCVVEADEYDRSFLKLSPDVAVITAMDPDHLDIYGTPENVENAFIDFSARIKAGGLLVSKYGLKRSVDLMASKHITYHLADSQADIFAEDIRIKNGSYIFSIVTSGWRLDNIVLNMGGLHNIENLLAAVAIAHYLGIEDEAVRKAAASFRGVKRRFEYIVRNEKNVMIDDYAHHPEELRALITGARSLFPEKKCTVIFQPHLYTRTKDLAAGFSESLDLADEVVLLPIYPARELPIDGVSSELILSGMQKARTEIIEKTDLPGWVKANERELIIMAGAGDIDTLVEPVKQILENK